MRARLQKMLLLTVFMTMALCISVTANAATKGYSISKGNTTVYSNESLNSKYGTIYGSDEVIINSASSTYCKVTYPTARGKKTGFVKTSAFFALNNYDGNDYIAKGKVTTYKRPGGSSYGYIAKGDSVRVFGTYGKYTQVTYPVSGGYKVAFITTDNCNRYIRGDNYASPANGMYIIRSYINNNKVLDVDGGRTDDGVNVQLWDSHGGNNQKFNITHISDGWYKIADVNSGKNLDVSGGVSASGVNVQIWHWLDNGNNEAQLWRFYDAGNGCYSIKNKLGYYLDANEGVANNGTNIQVWTGNGTNAQKWKLESTNRQENNDVNDDDKGTKVSLIKTSEKGIELLIAMERPVSEKYCKYDSNGSLIAIKNADFGDGGITVGFGSFFQYNKGTKDVSSTIVKKYKNKYGIDVGKIDEYVPVSVCKELFREELSGKEDMVRKYCIKKSAEVRQCVFDAMVIQAYNGYYKVIMDAYYDDKVSESEALQIAIKKYKTLKNWSKYGKGWKNRLTTTVRVAKRGIYVKDY